MRRVIVESPYAGDVELNLRYLRACLRDCILRGESPYASHGLLTQPGVLRDDVPEERKTGIEAGYAWWEGADDLIFYIDLGWSRGMLAAKERYEDLRSNTSRLEWLAHWPIARERTLATDVLAEVAKAPY